MHDIGAVAMPVEQATVQFYEHSIVAVRLADGRVAAVFSELCKAIGLERSPQARRIRSDEVLSEQLLFAQVETEDGIQPMDVLTPWAIPTWLTGIKLGKIAPERRAAILAFKRQAADVLYNHFSRRQPALSAPTNLVPSEPITEPTAPERGSPPQDWIRYYEQMIDFLSWQADIKAWRGQVESRLESVEEVTRLVPEILERLGPQTLTPEHQRSVQGMVKRLHDLSGRGFATIYAELGEAFHAAKYSDIPESRWEDLAAWFRARIERASRSG